MKKITLRSGLMATTTICGFVAGTLVAAAIPTGASAQAKADDKITEVVVTGSRIRSPNKTAISPITTVSALDIKEQGVTRIEDMVNSLPQVFAGQGSMYSNGSNGTATVNLRGLGSSRTLVLVNGRRLGPGVAGSSAADLNFIPTALVKRVDVVTGGGSAVYGSDAIAGVVNFIMDTKFSGLSLQATSAAYQHKNDDATTQAANNARGFTLPKENVTDGRTAEYSIAFGSDVAEGKGHVMAYAAYRSNTAILEGNRDYSACTLNSGATFTCGGSGTANPARIGSLQVAGSGATATLVARSPAYVYNFGPTNYYMRPDERFSLGGFANYKVNDHAELYSEVMFMDDKSVAQIAPGGIFASTQTINCDNAFATAQQLTAMCGANAGVKGKSFTGTVARRNVEGGGRQSAFQNTDFRLVQGIKGDITQGWKYDASLSYYSVTSTTDTLNYFLTSSIKNALIAVKDSNGKIVCQSVIDGTDTNCVPYNLFSAGGVTQEALNYLQAPSSTKAHSTETIANVSVTGDLGQYGVKSPWATDGVGVAFGYEMREDKASFRADYLAKAGLLSGAGGASPDLDGTTKVKEFFAEALVPVLADMPLAKSLNLEFGYRNSDYGSSSTFNNYKIGADWSPISELRFRASYQRASRGANIGELFSPQNVVLDGSTDPCAGTKPAYTAAQCALTGVTAAQYGKIEADPANQYNGKTGGNPNLTPEISDTVSFGFVAQPSFIPGLVVTSDVFDIRVRDFIGGVGADLAIKSCLTTGSPFFCGLIHRDSQGSLFLSPDGYIVDTNLNTGSLHTSGVDLNAEYSARLEQFGIKEMGSVSLSFNGTYLKSLKTQPLPGSASYDCAGLFGSICGTPNPTWRHKVRLSWNTPWHGLHVSAQWRYLDKVTLDALDDNAQLNNPDLQVATDLKIKAYSYLDLTASIPLTKSYLLRVGANNVFDVSPPLIGGSNGGPSGPYNGNTFAQVYDSVGRYVYATVSAKF